MTSTRTRVVALSLALGSLALGACESLTETAQEQPLSAAMEGDSVRPTAVTTTGQGSWTGTLRYLNGVATLDYQLSFSGLVGVATEVHLHGPAAADASAPILVDLGELPAGSSGDITLGATSGTGQGMLDLALELTPTVSGDSLHKLLDAGLVYVDVHTSEHTGGEIRGQIRKR